ncbi:MAG: maleylpyruvate isomerase family mycothiol-dependent enzyme [Actinomycetota bacterium]
MSDASLYDDAHERIVELVTKGDREVAVPTCPGWTVGDLVAHLAGGLGDFVAGRFDGAGTDEWGERQVRERRDRSLAESLDEWKATRATATAVFESRMGPILVTEIVSHEHDIRTALGKRGERDGAGVRAALNGPLGEIDRRLQAAGLPALRVIADGEERILGEGEPAATLRTTSFELLRTISGRRSSDQARRLDWDGDPAPWLEALFVFGPARADVVE